MDQFLAQLPKPVAAALILVVGFVLIIAMNPPKTVCDSQMELFRTAQKDFLYSEKVVSGEKNPPPIKRMFDTCRNTNSPGGCFELFAGLKKLGAELESVPAQCSSEALAEAPVKEWLSKSLKLMVQIPWGERGPASVLQKNGWFDASDLALYCDLNRAASKLMGKEKFEEWRDGVLAELPKKDNEDRDSVWRRSLFSMGCGAFR
jgi:hypothetical protein